LLANPLTPIHFSSKNFTSEVFKDSICPLFISKETRQCIDHFTRCKQHWSRSTSCFSLTLHKSWDKIQPTEHLKLSQKVKQTSLRCFLYMWIVK